MRNHLITGRLIPGKLMPGTRIPGRFGRSASSPIAALQRRRRRRRAGVAAIGAVITARRTAKIAKALAKRMR